MAMDEFSVTMKARELVRIVNSDSIPAPVEQYLEHVGAILRVQTDLDENEPGWSFKNNGTSYICVNGKDRRERQRFTVCHELAHIFLGLPSDHGEIASSSHVKKSQAEIFCDVFAAELLLPYRLFQPMAEKAEIRFASIDRLANEFEASVMATGSRFATVLKAPCAFVISENGRVRYTARSKALREVNAWISPRLEVPKDSISAKLRDGDTCDGPEAIGADVWFRDWERGGILLEEARHLERWDQTLTLLWFEDEEVPSLTRRGSVQYSQDDDDEDGLLEELGSTVRWPGKSRRR